MKSQRLIQNRKCLFSPDLVMKYNEVVKLIEEDGVKSKEARDHSEQNWRMVMNSLEELLGE